jgi:glycosyltransferase involved in cell wall biosynthesis
MISILMPIYNGIEFIDESVQSIINQTYKDWELIIGINGHSKDSHVYRIALDYSIKDNRIRVLDLYNFKGKSNSLNEMLKYCTYNYIALLDVDDKWTNNKLAIQSQYLNNYDVIGSRFLYFGESHGGPDIPTGDLSNFDFFYFNPMGNSSTIIRKELCYWDSEWDCGIEDYDLWLRLKKLGKKFYNCHEILMHHRIHKQSFFNAQGNSNHVPKLLEKYRNM